METATDQKEFLSGERLYIGKTEFDPVGVADHLERYEFTKDHLKPGARVLDAACGTGYGTEILAKVAGHVVGLEFNEHALAWAKEHYMHPNTEYLRADLNKPLTMFDDKTFDAIASFETLEHVEDQETMLSEFKRILKPGGLLFLSSPDREIITDKAHTDNHFHVNELSKKEFVEKMKKYFLLKELYGQSEYYELPWHKKAIKKVAKLDVLKLRRKVVRALGLKMFVHKNLAPVRYAPMQGVGFEESNKFFILVAVCQKAAV
jgi:ubiquinone/menaquinone biosynthesis C-methylase UbiE